MASRHRLEKLKSIQSRFELVFDEMNDKEKKEFARLIISSSIKREEANIEAEELAEHILNRSE